MKKKIFIFDTETTGLPKSYKPAEEDINNYPNLVQFGGILIEMDIDNPLQFDVILGVNMLVTPYRKGLPIDIPPKSTEVHGIDFNKANALGESIETVSMMFQGLCNSADYIICHNYTFDRNVMVSELMRLGIKAKYNRGAKVFCTMKYSTNLLQLPGKFAGQYKFPKLEELFTHLTGLNMHDHYKAHDAEGDVKATAHCVAELINQSEDVKAWFKGEKDSIY